MIILVFICFVQVWSSPVINTPAEVTVQENHPVTLTCTETSDTFPFFITWNRDVGDGLGVLNYTGSSCKLLLLSDSLRIRSERYIITCDQQGSTLTTTLVIPAENVTEYEHNTTWRCASILTNAESNKTLLYVLVPTRLSVIKPDTNGQPLNLSSKNQTHISCITSPCRPPARVSWFVNDTNVTLDSEYNIQSNYSNNVPLDGPLTSTNSTILIPWGERKGNQTVKCVASNFNSSESEIVVIHVAPGRPKIFTNSNTFFVNETLTLYCNESGGNPYTAIYWSEVCKSDVENSRSITFRISKDMNGKLCICNTRAVDLTTRSVNVTLNVYYPPSTPVITPDPVFPWRENGSGILHCNAEPGNPRETNYSWTDVKGTISNAVDLQFSNLTRESNGRNFTCTAHNLYTMSKHSIVSTGINLDTEYKPVITVKISTIIVIEGHNVTNECSADSNPVPKVKWLFGVQEVSEEALNRVTLTRLNISRSQRGIYVCEANSHSKGNNGIFSAAVSTFIDVLFSPEVQVSLKKTVKNGQELIVLCKTYGNPNTSTRNLIHMFNGVLIRTIQNISVEFKVDHVTYQDSGEYICEAGNGVPNKNTKITGKNETQVIYPAQFCAVGEEQNQFYLSLNTPYIIRIFFITTEEIQNITWSKTTESLVNASHISFNLTVAHFECPFYGRNINVSGYAAEMHFRDFKENYEGNYTIEIKAESASKKSFQVILSGPPESPTNQRIVHFDHKSITLSWQKGLNGGYIQHFVIQYLDVKRNDLKTLNVTEENENKPVSLTIKNLQPLTTYEIIIYAQNEKGVSTNWTKSVTTLEMPKSSPFPIAAIGGGMGSAVVLIALGAAIWFLKKRISYRNQKEWGTKLSERRKKKLADEDDDLTPNILYASTNAAFNANQDDLKPNILYESTASHSYGKKGQEKNQEEEVVSDNNVYAQVVKKKFQPQANSGNKKAASPLQGRSKTDRSLNYVQIDFRNKSGNAIIHGDENRTQYALIDFNRKADEQSNENPGE